MSQSAQNNSQPHSATNFDLPSLHILHSEIEVALKNAEHHLSEFNDDEEQAPLLLDSVDVMNLLAEILDLLSLDGGSDLTVALSNAIQLLYDNGDNNDEDLILDISEAIMTLNRYVEFVLLKETLEPTLLLPIINKLHAHLNIAAVDASVFVNRSTNSVSISNPEQNYLSPVALNLDVKQLSAAYRSGLAIAITGKINGAEDLKKLQAMEASCAMVAEQSKCLFWQSATTAVSDIASILPLTNPQKRTLVFLEQQFNNYLSVNDKRFADLVTFACQRNTENSKVIKQRYALNNLSQQDFNHMKSFLFGPNREVASTLNEILQSQINKVKDNVDKIARGVDQNSENVVTVHDVAVQLQLLSSTLKLLHLADAAEVIQGESLAVGRWDTPTPKDFDQMLSALTVAENASINLAKEHTPGAVNLPLHNQRISLHQLDTSYETLIAEARMNITKIEEAIIEFVHEDQTNKELINPIPSLLQQLVGPLVFLSLNDASRMTTRLANYVQNIMLASDVEYTDKQLSRVADVIVAVDFHLDGLQKHHPVSNQAINIGHESLKKLLAA